jgi:hypothetical protein
MFGDTDKGDDQGSGGSYGFGKSAFIQGSAIKTVFAYSAFQPFENDSVTRRFVGFSYWDNFNIKDEYFDGRAIFGDNSAKPGSPFNDKEADKRAKLGGFSIRDASNPEELGTSLALIAPQINEEQLLSAIEKWWWPALIDGQMEVKLINEEGKVIFPRPMKNEFVKTFIKSYSIAKLETKASETNREMLASQGWQKSQGIKLGEFALRIQDEEEIAFEDEGENNFTTRAVMRNPKMIVEYKMYERRRIPVRGVFIASNEADEYLKLSEPAQHDHWDTKPVSDASDKEFKAAAIAKSVDEQIRKGLSRFIDQVSPPSPRDRQVLTLFADLMSGLLMGKKVGPTQAPTNPKMPFEIQFTKPAQAEVHGTDEVKTAAIVQVSLSQNAKEERYPVNIKFDFTITEDEDQKGDEWPVDFKVLDGNKDFKVTNDEISGVLKRDTKLQIEVISKPYDANWTSMLKPKVELKLTKNKGSEE